MRKRFRGNYPVAMAAELKDGKDGGPKGGQLYAGKPFTAQEASNVDEDSKEKPV